MSLTSNRLAIVLLVLTIVTGSQLIAQPVEQADFFPPLHSDGGEGWCGRVRRDNHGVSEKEALTGNANQLLIGYYGVNRRMSYVKIDLTGKLTGTGLSLPVGSTVEEASFHYLVNQVTPAEHPTNPVKLLITDPLTASGQQIWDDMFNSQDVGDHFAHGGQRWVKREINYQGRLAIQRAAEQGWVAFGLQMNHLSGSQTDIRGNNSLSANERPFLRIRFRHPPVTDLALISIDVPSGEYTIGDTIVPRVRVQNQGNMDIPHYTVHMIISDAATDRVYTATAMRDKGIAPGVTHTLSFREMVLDGAEGEWNVIAYAPPPPEDIDPDNNRLESQFRVNPAPVYIFWHEMKPMPARPGDRHNTIRRGSWLTYNESDGLIYGAKGYRNEEFFSYNPDAGTDGLGIWTELTPPPLAHRVMRSGRWYRTGRPIERGARGISDGNNNIYMMHGNMTNAFWRYDIAEDSWYSLDTIPQGEGRAGRRRFKGGGDVVYVETPEGSFVYLMKGERTEFVRYNVQGDSWEERAHTPAGMRPRWLHGSWLAYDGANTIYAHKSRYVDRRMPRDEWRHELWAYDISADTWHSEALHGMPLLGQTTRRLRRRISGDGAAGIYYDGMLWALKGGNTQMFYQYDPATNVWTELDTIPRRSLTGTSRRVGPGGHLVSTNDGHFFAIKGNRSVEFWRYSIEPEELLAGGSPDRAGGMADGMSAGQPFLRIGPNPYRSGSATLQYQLPVSGPARLVIYDAVGRQRHEQRFTAQHRGALRTDLGSLSAGVYLVKLEAADQDLTTKLVIGR